MNSVQKVNSIFREKTTIFKNEEVFDVHTHPKNYLFRESQLTIIANNIKPALHGRGPIHTVLLGDYATGKTTAIRIVFDLAEDNSSKVVPVYINCKTHKTRFKVYSIIYEEVFSKKPPERGTSSTILFDKIMKELFEKEKILLIAFDDINYLLDNEKKGQQLFYELLRAYETFQVKIGVFPIITSLEFRYKFDHDVSTIFIPQEVIFPQYSQEEVYSILRDRCCEGFIEGVINHEILLRISDCVVETNNLRLGLNLLRALGSKAEIDGSDKITLDNYNELIKTTKKYI